MTYWEPCFSKGHGDGPKQVPTLLRASAPTLCLTIRPSRGCTTAAWHGAIIFFPFFPLTLFLCLSDCCCSWRGAIVCLWTTGINRFWRVMWNYRELFNIVPCLPFLGCPHCCSRCGFVYAGRPLYFSNGAVLALSAPRKPFAPRLARVAGRLCRGEQSFAPPQTGRGIASQV